jgi:purine nucleosidase
MTDELPVSPHCRVIVDNDYQGDPDGLVALAHHLVSPANRVTVITSSFLDARFPVASPRAEDGAVLARQLLEVVGGSSCPPVHAGSEVPFGDRSTSAASAAIVGEARRDDDLPLYLACGGPLTNVASALRDAPDIASRLTLIWIGGSLDRSAFEYNRDTDRQAAEFVFEQPELEIHQFPVETYRRCAYSVAELEYDLSSSGALGHWLWSRFTNPPDWVRVGGVWPLGDSPAVLVTALSAESSTATLLPAEGSRGAQRRVYTDLDFRLIVADMLARFRLHERHRSSREPDLRKQEGQLWGASTAGSTSSSSAPVPGAASPSRN